MSQPLHSMLASARSVALFGGTFDPIHNAHLILADCAVEELGVDLLVFVPAYLPPHKMKGRLITEARHRLAMLRLAIAGNPRFAISTHEIDDGAISYTADTVDWFAGMCPDTRLYLMLGADSARDFRTWHQPERIAARASMAVWARPGVDLPGEILPGVDYRRVPAPVLDISSTEIRDRVHAGRSVRYRLPDSVIAYIEEHGLYR